MIKEAEMQKINKAFFLKLKEMFMIIWKTDKNIIFIVLFEIVISSASYFPSILLSKYVIDAIVIGANASNVLTIITFMIGFSIIINSINIVLGNIREVLSKKLNLILSTRLCNKCVNIDFELYNNSNTLDMSYYAYQIVNNNNFIQLLYSIRSMLTNIVVVVGITAITIKADILIIVIAILLIATQSIITSKTVKRQKKLDDELNPISRKEDYVSYISTVVTYRKDLLTYNAQDFLLNKLHQYRKDRFNIIKKNSIYNTITSLIVNVLSQSYQFTLYVLFGLKVVSQKITIGDFTMYLNAFNTFVSSTNGIIREIMTIRQRIYYFDKYKEFMELKGKEFGGDVSVQSLLTEKEKNLIEFKNVSFKYPGSDKYVLKNINLIVKEKENIAIVGENGAGKSTFIMLLMRLYDPTEGEILFNGINIKNIKYKEYIDIFSTVFQDFQILGFSVLNNLIFKENINDEERKIVLEYLKTSNMENRINSMNKGLDTFLTKHLDDEGESLSGGEGQKMAIIRALIKNGRILIMDEPTSSLDPFAEYDMYIKFSEMTKEKTAIYISHRLASTYFCDKILVFNNGTIEEQGSHDNLIEKRGLYYDMFNKQSEFYKR